ncbi:unnamed protein product [Rotaria sp. Silwood1]|nr:unnamed protein product [Rotaria sp. Silwood1]
MKPIRADKSERHSNDKPNGMSTRATPTKPIYKKKEIEPRCAEALCRLFPSDPTIDIMSIATKAKNNKKRYSSRSQSRSPLSINVSSSLPMETSSSSSIIIKRQTSKDHNRHLLPNNNNNNNNNKQRPTSSDFSYRHSSNHHHPRLPSNHMPHRSDVTLYLIIIRLTNLAIISSTNLIHFRTFKKGVG